MENLISNACKYSSKHKSPIVSIGKKLIKNQPVFFIKDNGVGFNMDYAGNLFHAFQRLHSEKDFEGTGIGLATVKKIIDRHQGKIWAEAKENGGATFYFKI
ncbi:MAG: sensor histidine kinase [Candidatus Cyclobacteriaceae bacterium M2_1C_046]